MHILIVHSSTDGHTVDICRRLETILLADQYHVTLVSVVAAHDLDLDRFDKIVIGASIRYGRHRPELVEFLQHRAPQLSSMPSAFFSVNLVARKPAKNRPDSNPYMRKLLQQLSWRPMRLAVFAGKLDYPSYGFLDRQIIRFIMWVTNGPVGRNDSIDFTDWSEVDHFAGEIGRM
jgi:menaquinone-dependent protoporphyrinogen oxidase